MISGIGDDLIFYEGATQYLISHVSNLNSRSGVNAPLAVMRPGKDNIYIECFVK